MSNEKGGRLRTRVAKGRQPTFFEDPNTDKLLAMVVALTGEISVLLERLDTHERLAEAGIVPTREAIETFEPDETAEDERETTRSELLSRVFRVIEVSSQVDPQGSEATFQQLLGEASGDQNKT